LANQEEYNKKMEGLFERLKDKVVAVGECGLDYDRLEYSDVETQLR
jgi:TatD DNase family protein